MALASGRYPLHLYPTSSAPAFRSTCVTSSHAYMPHNSTSGNGSNVICMHQANIPKLKVALLDKVRKPVALLSIPVIANLVTPTVAKAFNVDGLPLPFADQLIQSLSLADLDPSVASLLMRILGPIFVSLNFLFIIRIVMSWYPQLPVDKLPYIIAFAPTEPVLEPTRKLIPPVGGVDVSPVIWVALMSFLNEILLGQQGLLVLLSQQQG